MYASFIMSTANNPSVSVDNFISAAGVPNWVATNDTAISQPIPHALTADNFRVTCAVAPGAGKSYVYTVMQNGSPTTITCTISGSAVTAAADTAHSAAFAAGDTIAIKSTPSGNPTAPGGIRTHIRQLAAGKFAVLGGVSNTAITTTQFGQAQGGTTLVNGTETSVISPVPMAMTASNLFVRSDVDPTPGNWTIQLRNETANANPVAALTAGQTTNSDTSNTAAFTAGQRWAMHMTAAASPAASRLHWGFSVTPANDGESVWTASNANQYSNSVSNMMRITGQQSALSTADSAAYASVGAGTAKAIYAWVQTAPGGAGKTYTVGLFKAGTATTVTVACTAIGVTSATGFTEVLADDDLVNIDVAPSSTPAASRIATGVLFAATAPASAPVNSVAPVASGTASKTFSFTSTTGTWSNSPTATSYQWQRDVAGNLSYSNITSATAANYTAISSDLTCHVRCVVTASNASGSNTAASNALGPVGDQLAVVSSVGAEWCANATVVYSVGAPTTPTYTNQTTAAMTTGWSTWYV